MTKKTKCTPFLRWAGGKRWLAIKLAPVLSAILESTGGTYLEPFLGSGAMFFAVAPKRAVLSDLNQELIETYGWVKCNPKKLINIIKKWPVDSTTFNHVRSLSNLNGITQAARFLYLNRTCYGGLYRTNLRGEFNTPFGGGSRTPDILWTDNLLEKASLCLQTNIDLRCCDFENIINKANAGDVIYCDPTYSDVQRGQFDRYGKIIYSWSDQERLADAAVKAFTRGVFVIISNGAFPELQSLYPNANKILLSKTKSIGRSAVNGNAHNEYLFILDPVDSNYWDNWPL